MTTNRRFESWAEIFAGDAVIAGAILDRLLHHRHILAINGPSYRNPELTGGLGTSRSRVGLRPDCGPDTTMS